MMRSRAAPTSTPLDGARIDAPALRETGSTRPKTPREPAVSRRHLLASSLTVLQLGSAAALLGALLPSGTAWAQDWRALAGSEHVGGFGLVKRLQGRATAAGRELRLGARVESGMEVQVAENSRLILSLSDHTILRINPHTAVRLHIGARKTGLFHLLAGSILTVMPKNNRYLVQMPTATIGIKGTVFFHQIFRAGERVATDEQNNSVSIPKGINEYFCLCNGLAEFLSPAADKMLYEARAKHHNSYYLDPNQSDPLRKAPQINHTDRQIRALIELQEGPQHDKSWLEAYAKGYEPSSGTW